MEAFLRRSSVGEQTSEGGLLRSIVTRLKTAFTVNYDVDPEEPGLSAFGLLSPAAAELAVEVLSLEALSDFSAFSAGAAVPAFPEEA